MRKITRQAFDAFVAGKSFRKSGNGETETNGEALKLHGNTIAKKDGARVLISLAGWNTVTTRERLKPFAPVYQSKHLPYIGDNLIDEKEWYEVGVIYEGKYHGHYYQ
mgnify:CR=1 FL=1